ncbi:hypothetical protein RHD99_14895 [Buttiauxella selenatireducens]|uniref:MarR family transcriptional regulator n=1 Tax=Buttiauxella selenatireducens TaxID=3073902 RepID=A0ABY9S6X9_9ENTR|nr:hypothetical protein [Buttiauxella sp. R73]WMY72758.1 hypothetical protein RHD99_14895 [Buttiauxella sp. R73]
MRVQIQNLILNFISENPGTQISAVVSSLPDVDRSSVSSALTRLTMQGKVSRKTASNKRFSYTIASGETVPSISKPVPVHVPAVVPKQHSISTEEWERRFSKAEALLEKGLLRRANQAFLELLDVTAETTLRDKIVRHRDQCGCKPSGDDSMMAGHFVGMGLV